MEKCETAVIGGGAAGLILAALSDNRTLLIERGERLGRKLSATGNGLGNLTNRDLRPSHYFVRDRVLLSKAENILTRHGKEEWLAFLASLGGAFIEDSRGRVYPAGRQASAVTDLLRFEAARRGVRVKLSALVTGLQKTREGFLLTLQSGEKISARRVVLCAGGKAAKNFGTDGNGYALAAALGHTVTALYPSLVRLTTETDAIKGLKGIRVFDAHLTAYAEGQPIAEARGDLMFADRGVSGDAVFRLSAFLTDKIGKGKPKMIIDFLPDVSEAEIAKSVEIKTALGYEEEELLCGVLNNRVGRSILKRLKDRSPTGIARAVKAFPLAVTGTFGFDDAQVTKGGIPLSETDENLQSLYAEGLYFAGEILDVDGECGGYNLQWAYSSALAVLDGLGKEVTR